MRWGIGGEATDTHWNMANSGFVKENIFTVEAKPWNGLPREGMTSPSLEMLKTSWASLQAACSQCTCCEQEVGLETLQSPAHPHEATNSRGPTQPLLQSLAKRVRETLMLNCLSYFSLPAAAT